MKLWRWQKGRQESAIYDKFTLWYFRIWKLGFDCYLLRFKLKTHVEFHTDVVPNGQHWRLNVNLKGSNVLTLAHYSNIVLYFNKKAILFRPDIIPHSFIVRTPTIQLSFGFVKFK